METIELTPDLIFERQGRSSATSGSLASLSSEYERPPSYKGNSSTSRFDRSAQQGYYSLGSKYRRPQSSPGNYGVSVSIQDIKGLPYVILEDKESQRHMVAAPNDEEFPPHHHLAPTETDTSSETSLEVKDLMTSPPSPRPSPSLRSSATTLDDLDDSEEAPGILVDALSPISGTLVVTEAPKESDHIHSSAPESYNAPESREEPFTVTEEPTSSPITPQATVCPSPAAILPETSEVSSPVVAVEGEEKDTSADSASPPSRLARRHRAGTLPSQRRATDYSTRSRSMSPNKALESGKVNNRSRSVSPPKHPTSSYTKVDEKNTKPVSNLIGFFEFCDDEKVVIKPPVRRSSSKPRNSRKAPENLQSPKKETSTVDTGDRSPPNSTTITSTSPRAPPISPKRSESGESPGKPTGESPTTKVLPFIEAQQKLRKTNRFIHTAKPWKKTTTPATAGDLLLG